MGKERQIEKKWKKDSSERPLETLPKKEDRRRKKEGSEAELPVQAEDRQSKRRGKEAERGKRGEMLLADSISQEEDGDAVESLIRAAQLSAFGKGAIERSSQEFHCTVRERVSRLLTSDFAEVKIGDVGQLMSDVLMILEDVDEDSRCKLWSTAGKNSIFPLPAPEHDDCAGLRMPFLQAIARALNSMHGMSGLSQGSVASRRVMKRLGRLVDESVLLDELLPNETFPTFFRARKLDYHGEEVQVARKISWKSIEPSLPQQVGSLDIRDFCEGGVLHYINHFQDFLVPPEEQYIGKCPSVMIEKGEWELVAQGLVERGLCVVLPITDLHFIKGQPLLNGMFCVSKHEFAGDVEICRLIMNLKPANINCQALEGDTGTLPAASQLGSIFLADGEVLATSSEDIRCFFYLFAVPEAWQKFLAFGREAPEELIPQDKRGIPHFLCSRVLPMGFVNSVGIAQHIHRCVVRRALGSLESPMLGHQEMRRDRVGTTHHNIFRVYLDNFDQLKRVDRATARLIEGETSEEVAGLREAYERAKLPRHPKKAVSQRFQAEVQGAWVDGEKGTVAAKPAKVAKYIRLALELLKHGKASQKELQVVGGGFVYISMFRRPLLGSLNAIWRAIVVLDEKPPQTKVLLRREIMAELARFIALTPLAFMNLRNPFDALVTASDASSSGGGVTVSRGVSDYGVAAASSWVRGDVPEEHDFSTILAIGLFDGIGALRVALDVLNAPIAGYISVEMNPQANRVVEANFPDCVMIHNVEDIDEAMVVKWSLRFSSVGLVLVGGGPPCQGVSGLNWDRKGALRDERSSLFHHVPRVTNLCKKIFKWAQVHDLAENVASMDWADCQVMNEGYDRQPWFLDAAGLSLAHRPRLYWCSWELMAAEEGVSMLEGSDGRLPVCGEIQLQVPVDEKDFLEPGCRRVENKPFPTFTTSRPSPVPLRRPAGLKDCDEEEKLRWQKDMHRFPPYQYKRCHCVRQGDGSLRPPSVRERESILGFPMNYTRQCLGKSEHGTSRHTDCRLTLLGNSWSVPVICWLLSQLLIWLGLIEPLSVVDIVRKVTPGKGEFLQGLLLRPPSRFRNNTFSPSAVLVQKLSSLTTVKGEDLLLQNKTELPVKFHRLRNSIPSKLWRWRTVAGWQWTGDSERINVLELRAVLTTIKWRVEQLGQMNIRSLHLVDSLVVLHALTRGRSSSRKLRRTLMRIGSILLACGLSPLWSYVDTKENPADRPSRRGVRKKWLKTKSK